jgi:hypothetical protein
MKNKKKTSLMAIVIMVVMAIVSFSKQTYTFLKPFPYGCEESLFSTIISLFSSIIFSIRKAYQLKLN